MKFRAKLSYFCLFLALFFLGVEAITPRFTTIKKTKSNRITIDDSSGKKNRVKFWECLDCRTCRSRVTTARMLEASGKGQVVHVSAGRVRDVTILSDYLAIDHVDQGRNELRFRVTNALPSYLEIPERTFKIKGNWYGRFANNIISLGTGLLFALQQRATFVPPKHGSLSLKESYDYLRASKEQCSTKKTGRAQELFFSFFNQWGKDDRFLRIFDKQLFSAVVPNWEKKNDAGAAYRNKQLVIHIRSGDLFAVENSSSIDIREYIQPPFSYYDKIIKSIKPAEIIIVTESDRKNPCIQAIRDKYPNTRIVSQSLHEDIELILRAKHLIAGRGTFGKVLALLSRELSSLHIPDDGFDLVLHLIKSKKTVNPLVFYKFPGYYEPWSNTSGQRMRMLTYPERDIVSFE